MPLVTEIKYGSTLVLEVPAPSEVGTYTITIEPLRKSGRSVRLCVDAPSDVKITQTKNTC